MSVPDTWMHLYAQYAWHSPARIVGTADALRALAKAIERALSDGKAETSIIFAADGEGYVIEIERSSTVRGIGTPEYIVDLEHRTVEAEARRAKQLKRRAE